jgi:hypothetical protein
MLTEEIIIDQITVLEDGQLQIRQVTRIYKDGEFLSQSYARHVVVPGASIEGQSVRVAAVMSAIHTPEVVEAYLESQL